MFVPWICHWLSLQFALVIILLPSADSGNAGDTPAFRLNCETEKRMCGFAKFHVIRACKPKNIACQVERGQTFQRHFNDIGAHCAVQWMDVCCKSTAQRWKFYLHPLFVFRWKMYARTVMSARNETLYADTV